MINKIKSMIYNILFEILSMIYIIKLDIFKKYKVGQKVLFHLVGDEDEGQITQIGYKYYKGDKGDKGDNWNTGRVMYLIYDIWYFESLKKIRPKDKYVKYIIEKI